MTDPRLPTSDEPTHPWADDAALYALDALTGDARAAFEAHLATCAECTASVRDHRATAALLALAVPSAAPPAGLRERIVARARADGKPEAAADTARPDDVAIRRGRRADDAREGEARAAGVSGGGAVVPLASRRPSRLPWLAAAAALLLATALGVQAGRERAARLALERDLAVERGNVATRDSLLALVLAPDVRTTRLTATGAAPSVRVYWNRERGTMVLTAASLPPAPSGRTYQLWGIAPGGPPRSLGTFDTGPDGRARAVMRVPADVAIETAAITEEPAGGSPQPTTTPFLAGQLRAGE